MGDAELNRKRRFKSVAELRSDDNKAQCEMPRNWNYPEN
jgi:hypothetical protein